MAKIIDLIMENVTFPADFTGDDAAKFGGEVASEVGKFLPNDSGVEDLIEDVTATSKSLTVKFQSQKHKAAKGEKIQFSFRLHVYLAVMAMQKVKRVTGFRAFPLDLTTAKFWENWNRAEVKPEPEPEGEKPEQEQPAEQPAESAPAPATQSA